MRSDLVDFHCHLDLYPDYEAAVQRADQAGVFTLTVTTTPRAWPRNNEVAQRTKHVRAALGLHPQLVAERASEIDHWEELLPLTRYVGEVGLDAGPRFYRSFDKQKDIFARVLKACARSGDKILTVHSVRATKAVLDLIETHLPASRGKVVMHWFTGTVAEARRATELGCYFSINSEMLTDDRRRALVAALPRDRLLTETDGPFTQTRGRSSEPADVQLTVSELAALHGIPVNSERVVILANLRNLLGS